MLSQKKIQAKFSGKKVTVMGLGVYPHGSGISAVRFLLKFGAKVTVTDLKTEEELRVQIGRLGKLASEVEFVLGRHQLQDFTSVDMIVKNPGVPRNSKFLQAARAQKIPIETDISLFFGLMSSKNIIGVTGTRGKSTTSTLLYNILSTNNNVILGGNMGYSPLAQLNKIKNNTQVVLELSSWMLESLGDNKVSPHISIFTNIYPDHLNTYRDIDDYAEAKSNIYKWQSPEDYVVLNKDNKYTYRFGRSVPSQRFWISMKEFKNENGCYVSDNHIYFRLGGLDTKIISLNQIKVLGIHNIYNVMSAVCVAGIYSTKPSTIRSAVGKFLGIPNRLELLRSVKGVKYYNDTTSTTPEAGIAALRALSSPKSIKSKVNKVILIAGGTDKGLDFKEFVREIRKHCKAVVLFKGTGTDKLLSLLESKKTTLPISVVESMPDAVGVASTFIRSGDILLLSPACASFGMFINEFDRGDQFRQIVSQLK